MEFKQLFSSDSKWQCLHYPLYCKQLLFASHVNIFLTAKGQQRNEEKSKDDSAVKKIDSIEQPSSTGEKLSVINADMKVDEPWFRKKGKKKETQPN